MLRSVTAALLLVVLAGCASTTVSTAVVPLNYTDLTDDFADLVDEGSALTPEAQAERLIAAMAQRLPGFYDGARFNQSDAEYKKRLIGYLAKYPAEREGIGAVAKRFANMARPAVEDFERRLGPVPRDRPTYLVVSMGEFDGGTRDLSDSQPLLFGADMIARYHGGQDPRPFFQHELFHIYHEARFSGCEKIWCSLWEEGLAMHVAHTLNPRASDAELSLTIPEPIRPALEAHRKEAVCATLARLDSTDDEDYDALFQFQRLSDNLPPRFGYLLGEWVAADLGRNRSLDALANLDGPQLRDEIEASLRRMATCA